MVPIILLIILGILLVLAELLLIPGGIITGLLGVGAMVFAAWLAFVNHSVVAGCIITVIEVIILAAIIVYVLRAKTWQKVSLHTEIDAKVDKKPIEKGISKGMVGTTITRLNPIGRVMFGEDIDVEAQSVDGLLDAKTEVEVTRIEEEKIYVKKLNN